MPKETYVHYINYTWQAEAACDIINQSIRRGIEAVITRRSWKPFGQKPHGFESHPLRHKKSKVHSYLAFLIIGIRTREGFCVKKQPGGLFLAKAARRVLKCAAFRSPNQQYARRSRSRRRIPSSPPRRRGLHIVRDGFFYCLCKSLLSLTPSLLLSPQSLLGFAGTPKQIVTFNPWKKWFINCLLHYINLHL